MKQLVKPSQVLRRAAERIAAKEYTGCCAAILNMDGKFHATYTVRNRAKQLFSSLYKPRSSATADWFWWSDDSLNKKDREARIFALLLTADMAESVGE